MWVFYAVQQAGVFATNQKGDQAHSSTADVGACGYMSPTVDGFFPGKPDREDGLGAACSAGRAHDGRGQMTDWSPGQTVQLQEVGWIELGGTVSVTGKYVELDEATWEKKSKTVLVDPEGQGKGSVAGTFHLMGGVGCTGAKTVNANNGNGAQLFRVTGILEFSNEVNGVANHGNKCKEDGPKAGHDGVKKSHANKPPTGPRPEKDAA